MKIDENQNDALLQLHRVKELLGKQKLVEGLLHRQDMPRHDLVESLVHKQNLVELQGLLSQLSSATLAFVLEALSQEEMQAAWKLVPRARKEQVLLAVAEPVRLQLLATDRPAGHEMTIRIFELHEGVLRQAPSYPWEGGERSVPIWVDLLAPEAEHLAWIRDTYGISLPDPKELTDIENSARFYIGEHGEVHLHSAFLLDRGEDRLSVSVALVLHQGILFSVRGEELPVFRLQRLRARAEAGAVSEAKDILLDLYAADVEYSANAMENIYDRLEAAGRQVSRSSMTNAAAAFILRTVAEEEDLNGRISRNLLDTRSALSFLLRGRHLSGAQIDDVREILRDIDSLDGHTSFLFNKINFQMDATVGFLNVNQNQDLKRLTVISVVFMPMNVLAGIGGMSEFSMMTAGIPWPVAYGALTVGMALLGVMTFFGLRAFETYKNAQGRRRQGERAGHGGP